MTKSNLLLAGGLKHDLNSAYERALPDRYADGTEDQEVIPADLEKQLKALGYIDELVSICFILPSALSVFEACLLYTSPSHET